MTLFYDLRSVLEDNLKTKKEFWKAEKSYYIWQKRRFWKYSINAPFFSKDAFLCKIECYFFRFF